MAAARQVTTLQGTAPGLIAQLQALFTSDAVNDQQRRRVGTLGGCLLVAGLVGGFFSLFLVAMAPPLGVLGILVGALLLVGGIVFLVQHNRLKGIDLDNDRLTLVSEFLRTMLPDLSDKKPLSLTLRHGDCFQFGNVTNTRTEGNWATGNVNFSDHQDTWLQLSGRLQDGSAFKLSVTQTGKRKAKPKRKYTKVQDRITERISLILRVPPEMYPHMERLQRSLHPDRLQGQSGLKITRLHVQGPAVGVHAATGLYTVQTLRSGRPETGQENRMNAAKLIGLLAFLYAGLSYCRADADAPAGQPAPPR